MNTNVRVNDKKRGKEPRKKPISFRERLTGLGGVYQDQIVYYSVLVLTTLIIYLMIRPLAVIDLSGFRLNQPSPRMVSAPFEFDYVDQITTTARMREAEARVSPVYAAHPENLTRFLQKLQFLAETVKAIPFPGEGDVNAWAETVLQQAGFTLAGRVYEAAEEIPDDVPRSTYAALAFYRDFEPLWKSIAARIPAAAGRGIADDNSPLLMESRQGESPPETTRLAVLVMLVNPDGSRVAVPPQEIRTQVEFYQRFQELINQDFPDPVKDFAARELAMDLARAAYTGPTLAYQKQVTEERRQAARDSVEPIVVSVKKEDTLIGKNDIVTDLDLQRLQALANQMRISLIAEVGYLLLALLLVGTLLKYVQFFDPEIVQDTRKISVIFLGVIMIFCLTRIAVHVSLLDLGSQRLTYVGYAVPLGALGVILTLLIHSRLALFCCGISSVYMGIILSGGTGQPTLNYVLVAFLTAFAAIYTVTRIRQRSDLYRAGGIAIILACVLIVALSLNNYKSYEHLLQQAEELKWALIWGAVNGGLVSILSMALLPIFEDFYGVVTDMKLLELSQKNELLQRLEQEAPGSYQHTMRVATMAESAAEAIGANALLTRVGCYYHDIGKIVSSQYFVENQQSSADKAKHAKLSINMSCLIIRSHVKHGIELAEKYNLPPVIIRFIPEHHGTTLMSYFYHQALEAQGAEGTVREDDFRYPGPKPQSKETAITMLADALEAASRTLENANEREVRTLVRKIINERFMDEQFDECNLTLKDLHTLEVSFSDTILHMLHQRIVYPASSFPKDKETGGEKSALLPIAAETKKGDLPGGKAVKSRDPADTNKPAGAALAFKPR
ncbi:MAG: HD family phosphohydrolase [bacterium]